MYNVYTLLCVIFLSKNLESLADADVVRIFVSISTSYNKSFTPNVTVHLAPKQSMPTFGSNHSTTSTTEPTFTTTPAGNTSGSDKINITVTENKAGIDIFDIGGPSSNKEPESKDMEMTKRLTTLRGFMENDPTPLSAYIIPTADAHNSEYIAPVDARREWLTGFTGSAGTAVVTTEQALVWTDGRYYTQFEKEVDGKLWTLMKQSLPDTPNIEKWLTANLSQGAVVGCDPHYMSRDEWTPLKTALNKAMMKLVAVEQNLVDEARAELNDPPPCRPHNALVPLGVEFTGKKACDKVKELRQQMAEKKAVVLVITALDEVAYTLNLRGSDIEYNPVFFSYLVICPKAVKLFWGNGTFPPAVAAHFASEGLEVEGHPYENVEKTLIDMAKDMDENDHTNYIWVPSDSSEAIHRAASGCSFQEECGAGAALTGGVSPVALLKMVKNHVELQGFRACHVRDGVAVVRLLSWLQRELAARCNVTEIQVADKLLEFRKEEHNFVGPSFGTIAAAGGNGAIIHYTPARDGPQRVIKGDDMFLLDSGGQYKDGTTDITRTRHMNQSASSEQKAAFTRVLKGQISIGSALFPKGVKGNVLDSFARRALWDVGLDYAHGTGHGVGHYLNVHEGPAGVSWRAYPNDPGLRPGQILSNEPGYYKVGEYGIRHEDLVEIIAVDRNTAHPRASNLAGDFDGRGALGFNTLTLVPHDIHSIDLNLLDDFELAYLNAYHRRVLETLLPILQKRNLQDDAKWLQQECRQLKRN